MAIDKADWHWDSAEKTYRKKAQYYRRTYGGTD